MSLRAGGRLGPYEVISPLGAGGMGEVYRARDTKLKRDVAIKILPDEFSRDRDRVNQSPGPSGLRFQKGRLQGRRDCDGDETIRGKEIVFATLVNDAKIAVTFRILVRQDWVDLVPLERRLVPVVTDADREARPRRDELAGSSRGTPCA